MSTQPAFFAGIAAAALMAGTVLAQQQTGQTDQQTDQQTGQQPSAAAQVGDTDLTLAVERSQEYGQQYLVDAHGRALYMFTADTQGAKQGQGDAQKAASACQEDCAQAWPPLLTEGQPVEAADPAKSDLLGTIERQDGTTQVTYNGWPLYYYVEDSDVGEAKGQDVQGFGGEWYLVTPEGEKVGHE